MDALGFQEWSGCWIQWSCSSLEFVVLQLTEWTMWPGNLWMVSRGSFVLGGVLATLIFFLSTRWKSRLKITLALIVLILGMRLFLKKQVASRDVQFADQVVQLDVGQGDAALVLGRWSGLPNAGTKNAGLIDVGSERSLTWDAWIRVFAQWGVSELSWIALTHLDEDHAGALIRLSQLVPIRCIATSQEQINTLRGQLLAARLAAAGLVLEPWSGDCVPFPTLGPGTSPSSSQSGSRARRKSRKRPKIHQAKSSQVKSGNENMSAIGVPLRSGGFYLSAGDANQNDELRIGRWVSALFDQRLKLKSSENPPTHRGPRLLKVSHHGSRYSTSDEFLDLIDPTEVWISSGQGNRYGHPSVQTLELLRKRGLKVRRTDQEGVIHVPGE